MSYKEFMSLITEEADPQIYQVTVSGNFYGGKYYENGLDSIFVLAHSPQEAKKIAQDNVAGVEDHFRNKVYQGGKKAISKNDKHKFSTKDIGTAKLTSNKSFHKTLTTSGKFEKVSI